MFYWFDEIFTTNGINVGHVVDTGSRWQPKKVLLARFEIRRCAANCGGRTGEQSSAENSPIRPERNCGPPKRMNQCAERCVFAVSSKSPKTVYVLLNTCIHVRTLCIACARRVKKNVFTRVFTSFVFYTLRVRHVKLPTHH